MARIAVIDLETTGLSPGMGERATEVAIVMVEGDQMVDRLQSLMNAGQRIPSFIEALTRIAKPCWPLRRPQSARWQTPAASSATYSWWPTTLRFDRRFWQAELTRASHEAA